MANGGKDAVHPDVGKDGPGGCDNEDSKMLDFSYFVVWNDIDTKTNDHEQVESC